MCSSFLPVRFLCSNLPDLREYVASRKPLLKAMYAALLMARREHAEQRVAEANLHRQNPPKYEPGDMVVVWRPKRDADFGGKLCWQNIGPFRVLEARLNRPEYRLQHLTTGSIAIHPVKHLHPYLRLRSFGAGAHAPVRS